MEDRYPLLESLELPAEVKNLTYEQLEQLALETRRKILNSVSINGGHLAPSLGVVELTIALLRVCNPEIDRIIWDVGHQSYPYKVLTDRLNKFDSLRSYGGISGFPNIFESKYDAFGTGHASTSISAGYGFVCADSVLGKKRKVVSVIGDGALSGGMAFEALNNLGSSKMPMVVVLNDNEMSISKNVGAMSASLSRIMTGEFSLKMRKDIRSFLDSVSWGKKIKGIARRFEESTLAFFTPGSLFEELGLRYIGPIDGHKIKDIEKALNSAFAYNGPVLIHMATVKGKGYAPAEKHPDSFHGIASFDITTGQTKKFNGGKSWTQVFGEKLTSMAHNDSRIVAVTAAMTDGTGLKNFANKYPERFFDVGIAEEHAVTFAAGLAAGGARPYVAMYSTFLQRAFDQLIHDVALQKLPVRICIDRAGLVGQDGATHHGAFDISYMRMIPDMAIFLPKDTNELEEMMELSLNWDGPLSIRYARGTAENYDLPSTAVIPGEPELIYEEGDYAIISAGHIFSEAYKFWQKLKSEGHRAKLINLRFASPLNTESLLSYIGDAGQIFTFEENVRTGGIGEMIEFLVRRHKSTSKVHILSLPDSFVTHGSIARLRQLTGITAEHAWELFTNL